MEHSILNHFKRKVKLSPKQEDLILSKFKVRTLKKREVLLENYTTCNYLSYVKTGALRVYCIDDDMLESNVYFATEDWWVVDLKSFVDQSPARFNIQALTECELLTIHKSSFEELLEEVPALEKWFRILLQNALIASEDRIHHKISFTAEQRYVEFLKKYPSIETQISQKHVASYLGITAEHLSKIKSRRLKSKP